MFWENFYALCEKIGKKPLHVVKELGISTGSITMWKSGTRPSEKNLIRLAEYFGVTPDYFFAAHGRELNKEAPVPTDTEMQDVIIYTRNGKTVRKRLPKAEYEAAIKMLDALGSDFPDV